MVCFAVVEVVVIESYLAESIAIAGHVDNPRAFSSSLNLRQEKVGEKEVTDVVGPELGLESFWCEGILLETHDASVVYENIDLVDFLCDFCSSSLDRIEARQVQLNELHFGRRTNLLHFFDDKSSLRLGAAEK